MTDYAMNHAQEHADMRQDIANLAAIADIQTKMIAILAPAIAGIMSESGSDKMFNEFQPLVEKLEGYYDLKS